MKPSWIEIFSARGVAIISTILLSASLKKHASAATWATCRRVTEPPKRVSAAPYNMGEEGSLSLSPPGRIIVNFSCGRN